jgi:hypothetical protein
MKVARVATLLVVLGVAFALFVPGSAAAHDGWTPGNGYSWNGSWDVPPYGYGFYGRGLGWGDGVYWGFSGRPWGYWTAPPYGWAFGYRSRPYFRPYYRRYHPYCWR